MTYDAFPAAAPPPAAASPPACPTPGRLVEKILATGTLHDAPDVPERVRRLFVTANEVGVDRHLAIQQAFQRHVDNAVSKTINLPEDAEQDRGSGSRESRSTDRARRRARSSRSAWTRTPPPASSSPSAIQTPAARR